jgi:CRP-like cAMP-binding protein
MELFRGVPASVLDMLSTASSVRALGPSRSHPLEDLGSALVLVVAGVVETVARTAEGREVVLGLTGPGGAIGAILGPAEGADRVSPYAGEIRALEESVVLTIPADLVRTTSERCPSLALAMLDATMRRLHAAETRLSDAVLGSVGSRLANRLLELAAINGTRIADGILIETPLTQEQLAGITGATRETVNRTLSGFAASGWVKHEAGRYVLTDVEALSARATP